ncbi:hypothetical protein [Waltera sp.]
MINYGLNDYFSGYAVDDPEDPYDTVTYCGALEQESAAYRKPIPMRLSC